MAAEKMTLFSPEVNIFDIRRYRLMKKNKTLLYFELSWDFLGQISCSIESFSDESKVVLPYPLQAELTPSSLLKWLSRRFIPRNRKFVEDIISSLGNYDEPRLIKLLDVTKGLSLTDDYWVLGEYQDLRWEDCNLYDNHFSEVLSEIAFTGYKGKYRVVSSSPEFTTDGMLPKCWRRINNKVYLFKGGTDGAANAGNEPYAEFYASQVAEAMGIDHVSYDLEVWKGTLCSVCELFTNKDKSYVSAYDFFGETTTVLDMLRKSKGSMRDSLLDIMVFDMVILNTDRHYGNFGFIVNNSTGKIEKVAPVFDNGMSLLHQALDSDFKDESFLESYFELREVTFAYIEYNSFDLVRALIGPTQIERLRKLFNFKFRKHSKYNWSDKRLGFLEGIIRNNARNLVSKG